MNDPITITVPREIASSLAWIIQREADMRLTPSGAESRSGKGDYKWIEEFRNDLVSVADQIREGVEAGS